MAIGSIQGGNQLLGMGLMLGVALAEMGQSGLGGADSAGFSPEAMEEGGGSPFGGSPFGGSPFGGSPFGGSPFGGSPFGGSPFGGSPFGGSPFGGGMNPLGMLANLLSRATSGMGGIPGGCGCHHGQQQGQPIQLAKGSSWTSPGGSTISWKGDTVSVSEKGSQGGEQGGGNQGSLALSMSGSENGNSFAMALAATFGGGNPACGGAQQKDWSVFGDPHIKNPDGKQGEFKDGAEGAQNNGMFTLQDGTRVVIEADGPNKPVQNVLIFPPGSQLGGFDPTKTTNWQNDGGANGGEFKPTGTVAQSLIPQNPFAGLFGMN